MIGFLCHFIFGEVIVQIMPVEDILMNKQDITEITGCN